MNGGLSIRNDYFFIIKKHHLVMGTSMKLCCLRKLHACALSLFFSIGCSHGLASTVYSVDRSIGVGGVSGYIETDDTIGTLASNNITDWQLLINDGQDTFTLLGPKSGLNSELAIVGTAFSATASDLLFDFSGLSGQHVLFQNPNVGSAINFWCLDTLPGPQSNCASNNPDESVGVVFQNTMFIDRSGSVSIGVAAVPVPATVWLFGSGLFGLIGVARRKKA